ncbi:hypothetical protein BV898_05766 [Hypsibius exemplaris]|uniref:Uncharacterized protein n=1 Tax=Hypsibius exemplaris TaxID=2072580 RepID=A0A1W0WYC7_HYPEX|nr:hypothetical protein BV898_05766 [Hypsibius exemplaris]
MSRTFVVFLLLILILAILDKAAIQGDTDEETSHVCNGKRYFPATYICMLLTRTSAPLITCDDFKNAVICGVNTYPVPTLEQYNNGFSRAPVAGNIIVCLSVSSDGLTRKREPPLNFTYASPLNVPGKKYYGRGYINLAWTFNYLNASLALYGNDAVAWDMSFWFWKANVHGKPGVDKGQFGVTVGIINGQRHFVVMTLTWWC